MKPQSPELVWQETNIVLLDGVPLQLPEGDDGHTARVLLQRLQRGRRHISPLAIAYLRGKTYLAEKQPHGGLRLHREASAETQHLTGNGASAENQHLTASGASAENQHMKTAHWLADQFQVGQATIRADARFALAVDTIAANCGDDALIILLAGDYHLTRKDIFRLAELSPEEQQRLLDELVVTGKLSLPPDAKTPNSVTVPCETEAFADKVLAKFGDDDAEAKWIALGKRLGKRETS